MVQDIDYIEHDRFLKAREAIVGKIHNDKGIGTLSEKTVHGVLKNFFEPEPDYQEVALQGYFADICNQEGVIEIQTRGFDRLREKLAVFLNAYPVTIVYPMPCNKWVSWIDKQTGEVCSTRKSPRHYTMYDAFFELYKIKNYLQNENLKIKLVLMDMQEYKLLEAQKKTKCGQRKVGRKEDRIPMGIREIITVEQPEDYMQFVPYELGETFTSQDFAKAGHISADTARMALNILHYMGTVKRVGKQGRAYLYEVNESR